MGIIWLFISIIFLITGFIAGAVAQKEDNEKLKKKKPTPEQVISVLEYLMFTYRCTDFEKECLEEAIRYADERVEEDEALLDKS